MQLCGITIRRSICAFEALTLERRDFPMRKVYACCEFRSGVDESAGCVLGPTFAASDHGVVHQLSA